MASQEANALRHAGATWGPPGSDDESVLAWAALQESVQRVLFDAAALGPIPCLARLALEDLGDARELCSLDDEPLHGRWERAVRRQILRFSTQPLAFQDPTVEPFLTGCTTAFDLEQDRGEELIQRFHGLGEAHRFGLFLHLETREPFRYLARQIETNQTPRPLTPPDEALSDLMAQMR